MIINNNTLGIIFANVHDDLIPELTEKRSMASVPIGGRYRLIDFSLSNLVNTGISKVGIITKENYHSLMDHLGSGKAWDLDRKNGGIFILPPFSSSNLGFYRGHVEALAGVMTFLRRSTEEYVVMCDADVVSNIDIAEVLAQHKEKNADVTVAYKRGRLPINSNDIMILDLDGENKVIGATTGEADDTEVNFSLDVFIIRRELLIDWINAATKKSETSLTRDVFMPKIGEIEMYAYEVTDYAEVMDSTEKYVKINRDLLRAEVRKDLFNKDRPLYTKTGDDMPTRYAVGSNAVNSLIADGCVIEGTVKNSVLFRGVTVKKGAVVENCIIMKNTVVGENCRLNNVTIDKSAVISDGVVLSGTEKKNVFIEKGKEV